MEIGVKFSRKLRLIMVKRYRVSILGMCGIAILFLFVLIGSVFDSESLRNEFCSVRFEKILFCLDIVVIYYLFHT